MVSKRAKDTFKMMSDTDKRVWKFLALMFDEFGDVLNRDTLKKIMDNYRGDLTRIYIPSPSKFISALTHLQYCYGVLIHKKKGEIAKVEKRAEFDEVLKLIEAEEK